MSTKEEGAAPKGPPRDLVRSRGQELAEAPQDNLSTSHEDESTLLRSNYQEKRVA
jgi:hypothetical protein